MSFSIIYARNIFHDEIFLGSLYDEEKGEKVLKENGVEILKAQQIVPCWDEPAFKTTFTISIKHHKKYTALSNMLIKTTKLDKNNMKWTHFYKSPFMSVQHLTIVITTFSKIPFGHTNVTIWCRESTTQHVLFALNIVEQVVSFLKERSVIKIQKIDYVAFWDVQHSNIETLGLILHREEDITYIGTLDSVARKIEVVNLLARQIVSLWYHDLLWPIEGFTTYLAAYILGTIPSLYYLEDLFVVQVQQESLHFDIPSYTNTTLLNINDLDVQIIKAILNHLKSSILWRVLRYLPTKDVYFNSIDTYASKYYQSNAEKTDDLWHVMQTNLNLTNNPYNFNVKKYIDIWIKNNNYPILYAVRNNTSNVMLFSYLSPDVIDKNVEQLPILVTYAGKIFEHSNEGAFWLSPQKVKNIGGFPQNECLMVNIQQGGYYRVNYNSEGWLKLEQCLISENYEVHALNQAQIIDDAFYFFKNRQLSVTTFWNLASFLSNNTNYIAWYPMIKVFEYMACTYLLDDTTGLTLNMIKMLSGTLQIIGYEENLDHIDLTICLREEVAKWACILGVTECRKAATLQLIKDLQNPVQDNRVAWKEWKYCSGLMSANYTIWTYTFEKWTKTSDNRILNYLICCEDPFIITTYLNQTIGLIDKSIIKEQDMRVNILLLTVAKHVKSNVVLDFLLKRLESNQFKLCGKKDVDLIVTLIVIITNIHDVHQIQKVISFVIHLDEDRYLDAIRKKAKKRRSEHARLSAKYGSLGNKKII
ncbi:aminopeptidase Ey-like isoform X2 [Linepithema humile]|uniref:aminopeptidase Ey-like isoform X2 n=1 Tax=Linepithema humile TaxID=83485 RepID=UPI00351F47E4